MTRGGPAAQRSELLAIVRAARLALIFALQERDALKEPIRRGLQRDGRGRYFCGLWRRWVLTVHDCRAKAGRDRLRFLQCLDVLPDVLVDRDADARPALRLEREVPGVRAPRPIAERALADLADPSLRCRLVTMWDPGLSVQSREFQISIRLHARRDSRRCRSPRTQFRAATTRPGAGLRH
jgi:hypothetical protein